MRILHRLAFASGGALLVSFAAVPIAFAAHGADDTSQTSTGTSTTASTDDKGGQTQTSTDSPNSGSGSATTGGSVDSQRSRERKIEQLREQADELAQKSKEKVEQAKAETEKRQLAEDKTAVKLADDKLKICENRQKTIDNLMGRIGRRGDNHIELISTIADRIEAFSKAKNLNISNFNDLVAAINSAKASAQSAADAVNATQSNFKCDGTDPTGTATDFKTLVQARNDAIKAYRDTVKQLLQAVKTAAQASSTSTTDAPAPSTSTSTSTGGVQ